ncbi:MAG TPA: PQQ-binding-like beta-propeller repeat protein [Acidimicrobiales bacterium]|nr:PQQ-binding-like beta-propeller repeat protein [Acidimicrobiales bacterium]
MRRGLSAVVAALAVALLPSTPAVAAPPRICNWSRYGRDASLSFAAPSRCTKLNRANAALMVPKWYFHGKDSMSASTTVVDGVVYEGSWDGVLHALSAKTGKQLWSFKVDDSHENAFGRIVSTAAVDTFAVPGVGKVPVLLFGGGGTLYALAPGRVGPVLLAKVDVDPRTPELKAKQDKAGDHPEVEIESSPLVAHFADGDRIYVGFDLHNNDHVGRAGMLAFTLRPDVGHGRPYAFDLAFKFDPERHAVLHSLTEDSGSGWGCGDVWSSPAFQPTGPNDGVVVFGTGNCDHSKESAAAGEVGREGIFAINARSGQRLWEYHPRPPQDLDDDFGASPNILDNGAAVGEGGKDGWYYKLDLHTGKLLWASHAGQAGHLNTGFAVGGFIGTTAVGRVKPAGLGASRPAIFGAVAIDTPIARPIDDHHGSLSTNLAADPTRVFSLVAIDEQTGDVLWRAPITAPSYGAVTYSNGVVLMADTVTFSLDAFNANTGALLASRPIPGPPSSAPVVVGDSIYVAIGTSESDLEFKAFGHQLQNAFSDTIGESPLSPLSGVIAFKLPG